MHKKQVIGRKEKNIEIPTFSEGTPNRGKKPEQGLIKMMILPPTTTNLYSVIVGWFVGVFSSTSCCYGPRQPPKAKAKTGTNPSLSVRLLSRRRSHVNVLPLPLVSL